MNPSDTLSELGDRRRKIRLSSDVLGPSCVLPIGGVTHKIEAAAKAGCNTVIIPEANVQDVMLEDEYEEMVDIVPCSNISEVLDVALMGEPKKDSLVDRLKLITDMTFQGTVGGSNPSLQ